MDQWYANLLTDHRWLAKRKERLAVDGYKCQVCGRGPNQAKLVVHHIGYIYAVKPWDYPLWLLQTLCIEHHNEVAHAGQKPLYAICEECGTITPEERITGRYEKRQWICEPCVQRMNREATP